MVKLGSIFGREITKKLEKLYFRHWKINIRTFGKFRKKNFVTRFYPFWGYLKIEIAVTFKGRKTSQQDQCSIKI